MLLSFYYAIKLTPAKPPQTLSAPLQAKDRKRKRSQEFEDSPICALAKPLPKRRRTSQAGAAVEDIYDQEATNGATENNINLIKYWI